MLINYVSYCKAKPKIILIKVKFERYVPFRVKQNYFLPRQGKNRLFLQVDYMLSNKL